MHIMRDCVDAIWFSMTPLWTLLWTISSQISNLNESKKSSLFPLTLLSKNVFFFVMRAKIEYKRHKKKKREKWNLQLLYLTSINAVCNNIGWWFFLNTRVCLYSSAVHSSEFFNLCKYADVIHLVSECIIIFFKPPQSIRFISRLIKFPVLPTPLAKLVMTLNDFPII